MKRNSSLDVIARILEVCKKPTMKTYVMYQTHSCYKDIQRWCKHLVQANLLKQSINSKHVIFETTEKGKQLLTAYYQIEKLLDLPSTLGGT